jgi:hypothetical protein
VAARFTNRNQELDYQANVSPAGKSAFEAARAKNPKLTYSAWKAANAHNSQFYKLGAGAAAPGAPGSGQPGDPGVPAGLSPEQQQERNRENWEIAESRRQAEEEYRSITDPAEIAKVQARILENYNRGVGDTTEALAGRGLTGAGVTADQLWDVTRTRDLADLEHRDLIRKATERFAAIKSGLDVRQGNSDLNFAAMAGANMKAPVPAVPGQAGYKPPTPTAPAKPAAPPKPANRYSPGDTTYRGPTKPGGKSVVYKGKDWSKVAQLFPESQFDVRPMPKVNR